MTELAETTTPHEILAPSPVSLATSTFYKNWYPGDLASEKDVDKIRGDLAIRSLAKARGDGLEVALVDGGSSDQFIQAVKDLGIGPHQQTEPGLSGSRRQAYEIAAESPAEIIFTTEPEKISLMESVPQLAQPLLDDEADIVIPKRNPSAFSTYPPTQADFEVKSNELTNKILRERGLLAPDASDIDFWVGARLFKNDPALVKLFTDKYDLRPFGSKIDEIMNLEQWQNALYLPVIKALADGLRVRSVEVDYIHPPEQTKSEIGDQSFDRKRQVQFRSIIIGIIEMVRQVEAEKDSASKPSRLIPSK